MASASSLGQQHEHDRAVVAGCSGCFSDLALGDVPLVADPDRDRRAPSVVGASSPQWRSNFRGVLLLPWTSLRPASSSSTTCWSQSLRSATYAQRRSRIDGAPLVELLGPLGAFVGLEPELVAELHDPALARRAPPCTRGTSLRSLRSVGGQVLDEKVGDDRRGRSHARVADAVVRELRDQEHQRACSRLELTVGGSVVESSDELVDLLQEHAALEHAGATPIGRRSHRR